MATGLPREVQSGKWPCADGNTGTVPQNVALLGG